MFLDVLASAPRTPATPVGSRTIEARSTIEGVPVQEGETVEVVPSTIMERAYSQDRGVVSLRMIPQTKNREADALLLVLYGYLALKNDHDVYGTKLMKAARQSGLSIDRIDRVISVHKGLYIRGGARRGARYALNNQGQAKARQILKELFMS